MLGDENTDTSNTLIQNHRLYDAGIRIKAKYVLDGNYANGLLNAVRLDLIRIYH